jgi:hypothetical protein
MNFEHEYHGVVLENNTIPPHVVDWLNERVGSKKWFVKGSFSNSVIYFENEKDHFLFLMTWGQSE